MTLATKLAGRLARLGPARHEVASEVDLEAKMRDGVTLLADRYYPADDPNAPVILVRTPYGRASGINRVQAHLFAERGFQYVVQSCRGTFGSGGTFVPFVHEGDDGTDALRWLREQPWCDGRVAMTGGSYVGYTQWSAAAGGEPLDAVGLTVTAASLRKVMWPEGIFGLDVALSWAHVVHGQEEAWWKVLSNSLRQRKILEPAFAHLPMIGDDEVAMGTRSDIFQLFIGAGEPTADLWRDSDRDRASMTAPALFVGGWYDLFLLEQVADFRAVAEVGHAPHLVIGPWSHTSPGLMGTGLRDGLEWYERHLKGGKAGSAKAPVRVFLMGSKRWVDLPSWPPATEPHRLHLQPGGRLAEAAPADARPDTFTYDPADPTPSIGGPVLGLHAGPRDNRKVEERPDVLTYTTEPIAQALTMLGSARVHVELQTDVPHIDLFARICDVGPKGKSVNLADQIIRLTPDDVDSEGRVAVDLELSPVGHTFLAGHRLRLQISGGAHPRFARNLGTGEPITTGTRTVRSTRQVLHDPANPSWIDVPRFDG